jgi:hypothetical protein
VDTGAATEGEEVADMADMLGRAVVAVVLANHEPA